MLTAFDDEELVGGFRLAVDFRGLAHIERLTGKPMPEVLPEFLGNGALTLKAKVMKGLMLRHYPEATLDEALSVLVSLDASVFDLIRRTFNVASEPSEASEATWDIATFLKEWIALGGSPSEFWQQTPRSYVVCMEGLASAATRAIDLAIANAWHTAMFGLGGYAGKLRDKSLSDFLTSRPETSEDRSRRLNHAEGIAFFHRLKAKGVPVDISRVN